MSLIVEDGTGLGTAESYLSVADADAYHGVRGNDAWADLTVPQREQALRQSTAYIDTVQRYKGIQLTAGQALEFPRSGLIDWSGREVIGVPKRVKDACAELALRASSQALFTDLDRGGKIKSEAVGPISTTYADDAPAGRTYTAAMQLLQPYARAANGQMGGPGVTLPTTAPSFDVGMHDFE